MLEGGIEVPARDECTEEAVDQILAYFQLKAISDRVSQKGTKKEMCLTPTLTMIDCRLYWQEWRKVKRLLEEGDSLNSQWSRRQGDV